MIYFSANTRRAWARTDDVITLHSVGIPIKIELSEDFNGLQTTFVFKNKDVGVDLLYSGGDIVLPHEITETLGTVTIGCYAAKSDGTIVIPTVWASAAPVVQGVTPTGIDPLAPTPSWAAQVQEISSEALTNSRNAIEVSNEARRVAIESADSAQNSANQANQYREAAERAKDDSIAAANGSATSASEALASANRADNAAERADQSAARAGYMFFYIDALGRVVYQRTSNVLVDFYLHEGELYVKAVG